MIVETSKLAHGGSAIARNGEKVIFVENALPNEIVEVEITEEKKRYARAIVKKIISPNPHRIEDCCPHKDCGACGFRHCHERVSLTLKAEAAFSEIRKLCPSLDFPDYSCAHVQNHDGERRRIRLHCENGKMGFYSKSSREIVEVPNCPQMHPNLQKAMNEIAKDEILTKNCKAELNLECDDDGRVFCQISSKKPVKILKNKIQRLINEGVLAGFRCPKTLMGEAWVREKCMELYCFHEIGAFMQANAEANAAIHSELIKAFHLFKPRRIIDAFAGSGNLSLRAATFSSEVYAIELFGNLRAFEMGKDRNMQFLKNPAGVQYIAADLEKDFPKIDADFIILDPPRKGLSKAFVQTLLERKYDTIAYISCEASCLGRDLEALSRIYEVKSLCFVDMFPRTPHVETCVLITRVKE